MPSRKQRRRRAKLQRHEYEYVIETDEGEVPVERARERDAQSKNGGREPKLVDRRGRPIPKPSLQRVLRRALVFTPILLLFVYLMSGNRLSMAGVILNAVILVALFIPFSYLVDVLVYRMVLRRHERGTTRAR